MANELIRPIDENTARAVEELSKTAGKGLDVAEKVGGYAAGVVGRTPHDLIAFLFGDRLAHWRFRQLVKLQERTREFLEQRGVGETEENPSVEIPLLEEAIDEGRDELVDLWAKLWASAMDPLRKAVVRRSLIDTVKKMEPIDAILFEVIAKEVSNNRYSLGNNTIYNFIRQKFPQYVDNSIWVSLEELKALDLIAFLPAEQIPQLASPVTHLGNMLWRAIVV